MGSAGKKAYPCVCRRLRMGSVIHPETLLKEASVFAHHCTACGKRQLIFPGQITSMDNTEAGIELGFTCWCGAEQTLVTGRRADTEVSAASAA
jgi:hypothetical protein